MGGSKRQGYFPIGRKVEIGERILRCTENVGRNESLAKLLMKICIWEGIIVNHDLPNKKLGFSLGSGEYVIFPSPSFKTINSKPLHTHSQKGAYSR